MGSAEFGVLAGTENASFAPATTIGGIWSISGSIAGAGIGLEKTALPRTMGGAMKIGGAALGAGAALPDTIGGKPTESLTSGIGSAARMVPKVLIGPTSRGRTIAISFGWDSSGVSASCHAKQGAIAGLEIVAKKASILILKF
jgi:hypothetical protein